MSSEFTLEICVNSVESAIMAQLGGAHRIELCDNIHEGGTTQSYGAILLAKQKLNINISIIIRPRGGDFLYTDDEFEIMKSDIEFAKKIGIDGVVLGILKTDGSVDIKRTKELVDIAKPMSVTFHRAFDVTNDPYQALEDIIDCGCDRILTSGQKNKAFDGIDLIKNLIEKANNRINIMPGSGINEENIKEIYQRTGAKEFHASLRKTTPSKMKYRKADVSMGGIPQFDEFETLVTDPERVKNTVKILQNL